MIITDYLHNYKFNFICLVETWTNRDCLSNFYFPGYSLSSCFSRHNFRGGGTAIWSDSNLEVESLNLEMYCIEKCAEFCGITWFDKYASKKTLLLNCYRSPAGNFNNFFEKFNDILHNICDVRNQIIFCGDFNLASLSRKDSDIFHHLLISYDLHPNILNPTHESKTSQHILDQIYTNFDHIQNQYSNRVNILENTISDHHTILFNTGNLHLMHDTHTKTTKRSLSEQNLVNFIDILEGEDWELVFSAAGAENKFNAFYEILLFHYNRECPSRLVTNRNRRDKMWVNDTIKNSSEYIKSLYFLQKNDNSLTDYYNKAKKNMKN